MFGLGMGELFIILLIVLILFGAGKLPEIGEGLGRGIRNFRKATSLCPSRHRPGTTGNRSITR